MPFVSRDETNEVTGVFATLQPELAEEELQESHVDIAAFLQRIEDMQAASAE